ncbi:MAG: VWA domain-containing protein [Planctomycetota bacterium]
MSATIQAVESAAASGFDLGGGYSFADPWVLAALPVLALLAWWGSRRKSRVVGRVSVLPVEPRRSLAQRLGWIPPTLQGLGVVLVVVALARPLRGSEERSVISEGVDIALVVDRSGSMRFDDLEAGRTRLDVVKQVVGEFATRRMQDVEGASDNCALITFARFPHLLCPFTLDVGAIQGFLDGVELVTNRAEDGTGIGVALAKAVSVLRDSDAESKVVVLLTDGENNVEDIPPLEAATLAAESNIRVHTIYAARYLYVHDPFRGYVATDQPLDTSELEAIAALTDGRFFRARARDELEEIYAEIERLERTPRREQRFEETFDLYRLFLVPALVLLALAQGSYATWARRIG